MSRELQLRVETLHGRYPTTFRVDRVYNMGWTIRDEEKQRRHMEEVERAGVKLPFFKYRPIIYAVTTDIMSTASEIEVQRHSTCGEVEFVLLKGPDGYLVTVGSDHTDRELESYWIPWSKQACANVLAPAVWPVNEVRKHWDRLILTCDVEIDSRWEPYQRAELGEFVEPEKLLEALSRRVRLNPDWNIAVLSGTVVSFQETLVYATAWRLALEDPVLNRRIEHTYRVHVLQDEFTDPEENMWGYDPDLQA